MFEDLFFMYVGLDFVGLLNIVNEYVNGLSKVYVCLFICVFIRVIYLELCRSFDV